MKITGKELANELGNFVNTYGYDEAGFIEGFKMQHRTLQQSAFKLICKLIEDIAETPDWRTDARNEGSVMVAKMLVEGFKPQAIELLMRRGSSKKNAEEIVEKEYGKPNSFLGHI